MFAVVGLIKLALEAGKATPAPLVGPALGSKESTLWLSARITMLEPLIKLVISFLSKSLS